jgi:2-aminobenzoate-CoA ligase
LKGIHSALSRIVIPKWLSYPRRLNACEELLDKNLDKGFGTRTAIRFESRSISYVELSHMVCGFTKALSESGVKQSNRVLIRTGNTPEFIASLLAIQRIGAIAVPTHPQYSEDELRFIVRDSGAKLAVITEEYQKEILALGIKLLDPKRAAEICSEKSPENHTDIPKPVLVEPDSLCLILYTSGTTGRPKGCVHTHRDYLVVADVYGGRVLGTRPDDVFGSPASLSFAYGHTGLIAIPLRFGAATCLFNARFEPQMMLDYIHKENITIFFGIPTAYRAMLPLNGVSQFKNSVRCSISAGEPSGKELASSWNEKSGVRIMEHLGSTEMFDGFIGSTLHDLSRTPYGCLGKTLPGYAIRLRGAHFDKERRMKIGEVLVRGPIAIRYWNRSKEQREATWHGWNRIRDIIGVDREGRYWYIARADELIKSAGYRISPHELEQAIRKHESVAEVAVIGLPDPMRGTIVGAYIIPKGPITVEEIRAFAEIHLAKYKVPRVIKIVDDLPRTATGKISRTELMRRETT